jgi:F0F1-type ATP synthase membrane subunit b/b'
MNPVKKFLLQLFGVYLAIAIPIAFLLGPPGFSRGFLEEYQNELDHYYEVVKSTEYKHWQQRPHLVEANPDVFTEAFAADVQFVQAFGTSEAYVSEMRRRDLLRILFNFLNAGVGITLIVHFGRKPLMDYLDKQVAQIRERLETARVAREEAEAARKAAEMQMGSLAAETEGMAEQAHGAAQEAVSALETETNELLSAIEEELALRKKIEVQRAAMALKAQLVEEAGKRVEARLSEEFSEDRQKLLVTQFLEGLKVEGAAK